MLGLQIADIDMAVRTSFTGNDIQALIGAISQFGTVKALASPRITVLNNQPAVLNVATNRVACICADGSHHRQHCYKNDSFHDFTSLEQWFDGKTGPDAAAAGYSSPGDAARRFPEIESGRTHPEQ